MTIQDWKTKINSYFQPKTTAERQKMMKYLVVFPAAILSGVVILWLLYSSLNKEENKTGDAFNTEIPAGESEKIGTKVQEYEAADAAKKKQARIDVVGSLDTIATSSPLDTVSQSSAIEGSVSQYQQVQASIQDFYVPDYSQTEQVAELQARIEELEVQNATTTQQTQQPDEMAMLERSYQLAAQYMGNGNGGNYMPPQQSEGKGKRNVQPVAQVGKGACV